MRDEERGSSVRHIIVFLIDVIFCNRVKCSGRFVKHEYRCVFIQCPCKHEPLRLPAGKLNSVLKHTPAEMRFNALGEGLDFFGQTCLINALPNAGFIDSVNTLGNVFLNGDVKHGEFLEKAEKRA